MNVQATSIPEVLLLEPRVFRDDRGRFMETYSARLYEEIIGPGTTFVQDNVSRSQRGVLRGLHLQREKPQGKLLSVSRGRIWDVAVDVRPGSETFGAWVGIELSDDEANQLWIPPGFAHGFCVLSDVADVHYKCTDYYYPPGEVGLAWDCPEVGVEWPITNPILSEKDKSFGGLSELKKLLARPSVRP